MSKISGSGPALWGVAARIVLESEPLGWIGAATGRRCIPARYLILYRQCLEMLMRLRILVLLAISSLLSACSNPFVRIQAPSVSIAQVSLIEAQLLEQRYRMQLRIQNPNPYALPISGMHYRLFLNGVEFARGVSSQSVQIPAYEERLLEVEMTSTIGALIGQLHRWQRIPEEGLRYRLAGEVNLSSRFTPVGFEYHGAIPTETPLTP